jgi:hypothetical protein
MVSIPQNIDAHLVENLSGQKLYEYLSLKDMTPDSSLDSLALAWAYRADMASQISITWGIGLFLFFVLILFAYLSETY